MARRRKGPVERTRDGFRLHLGPSEQAVVGRLLGELRDLLCTAPPDDPRLVRLFPTAYHDDPERDAEYQRLMRDELVSSRLDALATVEGAVRGDLLDDAELHGFMRSLNAVRLVLGTLLDIGEDDDPELVRDDDPLAAELHLYHYLSWLLDATVRALGGG